VEENPSITRGNIMQLLKNPLTWFAISALLFVLVSLPDNALMFTSPGMTMSFGLIGLGICMEARKLRQAQPAAVGRKPARIRPRR
jgi:hypothetical protein